MGRAHLQRPIHLLAVCVTAEARPTGAGPGVHTRGAAARLGRTRGSTTGRCTRRNEVERLFRRLKGYRRIFSRFEKLDVMFIGFIHFVLIFDALR